MVSDFKKNKEQLRYGLELFKYHADQRLRCIRFFVAFFGVVTAGILQLLKEEVMTNNSFLVLVALVLLSGITLCFWLLDIRNRMLTECAEKMLKSAEKILFANHTDHNPMSDGCKSKAAWHYSVIIPLFFESIIVFIIFLIICLLVLSNTNTCSNNAGVCLSPFILMICAIIINMVILFVGIGRESKYKKSKN